MALDDVLSRGWNDHVTDAAGVFATLSAAAAQVTSPAEMVAYARLVAHVGGEHLGRFAEAIALIDGVLMASRGDEAGREAEEVFLLLASLHLCVGDSIACQRFMRLGAGDRGEPGRGSAHVRVMALTAAMRAGQGRLEAAGESLEIAVEAAERGLEPGDPAARALAVAANNLACGLEEQPTLDDTGRTLMLRAARVARRYWAVAGTWLHVERAEYRLCMSHLKAGAVGQARAHAEACLRIVRENGGDPGESFFAHEACARAAHAAGDLPAAVLHLEAAADTLPGIDDADLRGFCDATLVGLGQLLGRN